MIRTIRVKNFRTFRDVEIKLGMINCLVGPNMSGKSNVLDIFRFLTDLLSPGQSGVSGLNLALNKRNGFREVASKFEENPVIEFDFEGTLLGVKPIVDWRYSLKIIGDFKTGSAEVSEEFLTVTTAGREQILVQGSSSGIAIFDNSGASTFQSNDRSRLGLSYDVPGWLATPVRDSLRNTRFYELSPSAMKQLNPSTGVEFLIENGSNLSAWLMRLQTRYQETFIRLGRVCSEVLPAIADLFADITPQSTVYFSSRERGMLRPTNLWQMSNGELCFIALSSLIFAPPDLGADRYCVEEPENHLHPRLISILIELLRQAGHELDLQGIPRGQVLMTTHSPFVMDTFSLGEIIVLSRKDAESSIIYPGTNDALREMVESHELGIGDLFYSGALADA